MFRRAVAVCVPLAAIAAVAASPVLAGTQGGAAAMRPAVPFGAPFARGSRARRSTSPASGVIQHIVIVIQENRTVDNLFNGYCNPNGQCANTVTTATIVPTPPPSRPSPLPTPTTVPLSAIPLNEPYDITHNAGALDRSIDCNGSWQNCKMDYFDWEGGQNADGSWWGGVGCYSSCKGYVAPPYPEIGYVLPSQIKPYYALANSYVLFDNLFASNIDDSFVAHQFLIAGQAGGTPSAGGSAIDVPNGNGAWGCSANPSDTVRTFTLQRTLGPPEAPCFSYTTLGDEIDGAPASQGLSWAFYAPPHAAEGYFWSAYQAISQICEPLNGDGSCGGPLFAAHVVSPQTQVLKDVAAGKLASVTWVVPTYADSDHPGFRDKDGPSWVAHVVNAVGKSKFWNTTAVVVVWDDWGGWYDHVAPPYLDYMGLGLRVPMLLISPYSLAGSVTSRCDPSAGYYEFGSILRFVEDDFGLPQMAASDTRAADPAYDPCVFNFNQAPRKFKKIPADVPLDHFLGERPQPALPALAGRPVED